MSAKNPSDRGAPAPHAAAGTSKSDSLIDLEAFQSIELRISMTNGTSRIEISDGAKASPKISLVEFRERGMGLEAPRGSCATGHNLLLDIRVVEPATKRMRLSVTAKVEQMQKAGEDTERIEVSIVQLDEEAWDGFKRLFSDRQKEIEEFFKAAKGI